MAPRNNSSNTGLEAATPAIPSGVNFPQHQSPPDRTATRKRPLDDAFAATSSDGADYTAKRLQVSSALDAELSAELSAESASLTSLLNDSLLPLVLARLPTRFALASAAFVCRRWRRLTLPVCVRSLRSSPFMVERLPAPEFGLGVNPALPDYHSTSESNSQLLGLTTRFAATVRSLEIRPGAKPVTSPGVLRNVINRDYSPDDDRLSSHAIAQIVRSAPNLESLSLISYVEQNWLEDSLPLTGGELISVVLPALPRQLKSLNLSSDHFLCLAACVHSRALKPDASGYGGVDEEEEEEEEEEFDLVGRRSNQVRLPPVPPATRPPPPPSVPPATRPPPSPSVPPHAFATPPAPPPLPPAPRPVAPLILPGQYRPRMYRAAPPRYLTDIHLRSIAVALPNLLSLNLDTPAGYATETLEQLATSLPHLRALSLCSDTISWETLSLLLTLLPKLQHISIVSHALHPQHSRRQASAAAGSDPMQMDGGDPLGAASSEALALFSSLSITPPKSDVLFQSAPGVSLAPSLSSIRLYLSPHRSVPWHLAPASSLLLALAGGCSDSSAERSNPPSSLGCSGNGSSSATLSLPNRSAMRSFHAHNAPSATWQLASHLFRHLTTLDLSQAESLPPPAHGRTFEQYRSEQTLCGAIRRLPLLQRLALPFASDAVLTAISQSCPNLTALHAQALPRFLAVSSAEVHAPADPMQVLSSSNWACLRVAPPPEQLLVTDVGVAVLAGSCTQLQELSLGGCVNVGPVGLRQLAKGCRRLEVLRLAGTGVDDAAVVAALFGDTWQSASAAANAAAAGSAAGSAAGNAAASAAAADGASGAPIEVQLPCLVHLDLYGCPGVSSGLLLALAAAAKELAGITQEIRDGIEGPEKEDMECEGGDMECEEEELLTGNGSQGRGSESAGLFLRPGLRGFRLRRLHVSPAVIAGGQLLGRKKVAKGNGEMEGGGGGGGCSDGVALSQAVRDVGRLMPHLLVLCKRTMEHVLPWDGFFGERKLGMYHDDDFL